MKQGTKASMKAAIAAVKKLRFEDYKKVDGEYKFIEVPLEWFEAGDGRFLISDERGGPIVIDYYDYFQETGGIHPDLIEAVEKHGCYWEWENPGAICLAY
jgi:hypothetical protein